MLLITDVVEGKKTGTYTIYSRPKPPHSHTLAKCGVRMSLRTDKASAPQQGSGEVRSGCPWGEQGLLR